MEKDIKILEEKLKIIESLCTDNCINKSTVIEPLKYAIKNLINRNRELEEKVMQKDLEIIGVEEYTKASIGEIIEHYYTANEDCIPKSKIKEKIEEVNKSNGYSPVNKILIEQVLNSILY